MEDYLLPSNGNGGSNLQGWIRLAFYFLGLASAGLWAVAEIKSDIRELDARLTGRINGVTQHLDDLKDAADKEHQDMRRRINRLEGDKSDSSRRD